MLSLTKSQIANITTVTPSGNDTNMSATFGLTGLLVFVIVVIVIVAVRSKCRSRSSSSPDPEEPQNPAPPEEDPNYEQPVFVSGPTLTREAEKWSSGNWSHLADDIKWMLKGHVIERERIRLGNVIGKGNGTVTQFVGLTKNAIPRCLILYIHPSTTHP